MTSDEILTHALEFETLRRGLDDGSPQGHEDGGIATSRQVQKAAQRVQGAVDVAWTRSHTFGLGALHDGGRPTWCQSQDLLGAFNDDGGQVEILTTR